MNFNKPCKQNSPVTTPIVRKTNTSGVYVKQYSLTLFNFICCTYYSAVRVEIVTMTARLTSKKWTIPFSVSECVGERHHHPCNVCIIPFPDTRTMTTLQPTDTVEEQYTCNVCDQMFIRSRILKVDGGALTDETPYSYIVCNESFSNTIRLMVHRLTHASDKTYQCNLCNESFTSVTRLEEHRTMLHTGEKQCAYDVCDRLFSQRKHLKAHRRTQMNKILHLCDVCKKLCISKSQLVRHSRIHTGEKLYTCDVCNKPFSQRRHLKLHSITHMSQV